MAMLQKIGAAIEVYEIEVTIHSVKFSGVTPSGFQVVVKRGKGQKEQTPIRRSDTDIIFFDSSLHFRVTMYKRSQKYLQKIVAFRLIQHTDSKTIKNGKATVDVSELLNSARNIERMDIPLKKASDRRASVCISLALEQKTHTSSITSDSTNLSMEKNASLRLKEPEDYEIVTKPIGSTAVRHKSPEKAVQQEEKKEMFLKRLTRLQTLNERRIDILNDTDSPVKPPPSPIAERLKENISEKSDEDSLLTSEEEEEKEDTVQEIHDTHKKDDEPKPTTEHSHEFPDSNEYEGQFVVKPIEIPCGYSEHTPDNSEDEEPMSISPELLTESPRKTNLEFNVTAGLVGLPPTSIEQTTPNANSKKLAIREREMAAGINSTRKRGACTGCLIF